jgi:hypothetical protein
MNVRSAYVMLGLLAFGCKTAQVKKDNANQEVSTSRPLVATFDDNGKAVIPMPTDLPDATEAANTTETRSTSAPKGLGLAGDPSSLTEFKGPKSPKNSGLGADIISDCYAMDQKISGAQWFFYAELYQGDEVVDSTETPLNQCSDIQLTLARLTNQTTYSVKAAIFYRNAGKEIIWYASESMKPFKPEDKGRQLVLKKVVVDQNVAVRIADSSKDDCVKQGYVWNSTGCINVPQWIGFKYTDTSTPGEASTFGKMKCLQTKSSSTLQACTFGDNTQRFHFRFAYFGEQNIGNDDGQSKAVAVTGVREEKISWFTIVVGDLQGDMSIPQGGTQKGSQCLTADVAGTLKSAACKGDAEGHPDNSQLFMLAPSTAADKVGAGVYRLVSMVQGTGSKENRCVSVKMFNNALPQNNGTGVVLLPCNSSSADQKKGQFLKLLTRQDYLQNG